MKIVISDAANSPDWERERLPDGRALRDIKDLGDLNRLVRLAGVEVSPTAGRAETVRVYVSHLAGIADAAGKAAVQAWMQSKRS